MLEQLELQLLDPLEQLELRAQVGFRNLFYCLRAPVPGAGGAVGRSTAAAPARAAGAPPVLGMLEQLELQLLDPLEQLELDFGDRAAA